jgi:hypothetical protein
MTKYTGETQMIARVKYSTTARQLGAVLIALAVLVTSSILVASGQSETDQPWLILITILAGIVFLFWFIFRHSFARGTLEATKDGFRLTPECWTIFYGAKPWEFRWDQVTNMFPGSYAGKPYVHLRLNGRPKTLVVNPSQAGGEEENRVYTFFQEGPLEYRESHPELPPLTYSHPFQGIVFRVFLGIILVLAAIVSVVVLLSNESQSYDWFRLVYLWALLLPPAFLAFARRK